MNQLSLPALNEHIGTSFEKLYAHQEEALQGIVLDTLLQRNPYLLIAKNASDAGRLVEFWLNEFLSSSYEQLLGDLLLQLTVFVASQTCDGRKSLATGVDLEFTKNGIEYLVSIQPGPDWGDSSQQSQLEQDLQKAVAAKKQEGSAVNVQPVFGICYGNAKSSFAQGYRRLAGQSFWYLISENEDLYTDIIDLIGFWADKHNEAFIREKAGKINRFTMEFIERFCDDSGAINWNRLVEWNSGNFDPSDW